MNVDKLLAEFNNYAQETIEKHTEGIKQTYSNNQLSTDVRLKVFNEHLDMLKAELQRKVNELAEEKKGDSQAKHNLLKVYEKHINEFFKSEF